MKKALKLLWVCIFFGGIITMTSCKGVKIKHGRDCGCGSFGHIEQTSNERQQ